MEMRADFEAGHRTEGDRFDLHSAVDRMAALPVLALRTDTPQSASPAHLGKRSSVLQEWQVLDEDLPSQRGS
jgi:hypothetical protein